jgi:MSHA biogenesis protein MshI
MLRLPALESLKRLKFPIAARRAPGYVCINVWPDRVDVSRVVTAGKARPEIELCHSYRKEDGDAATLAWLRKELQLDRYRCTTLLRSGDYQLVQVDAPNVPEPEARSAVRWRIKDMIDYPVEAAAVDAWFIPQPGRAAGRAPQMLAVAARNEVIAATVQPFHEADIRLEVIDIPELAQRNLARCLEGEGRGLALLAIDEQSALLTFTCGGELYQHRRIDVSIASLSSAFPDQRSGLYDRLVLELQRSLDHFDRQFHHVAVAKVVVTPVPGADDLGEHLAANLDVPVEVLYLSEIMDFPGVPDLHEPLRQAQCLPLIGGAMREEAV